ncbi:MAG: Holliday junction branch migration protein RuvA [Candidatus Nomurabacteria bacterium]|nr:Holliday junction branch migration protein RuvA [Candidatus Nomurabacteria bacterium]
MIGSIKGKIILKKEKFLVVETAGVGYKISVSPDTLLKVDALRLRLGQNEAPVSFWIHTHVREDAFDLYGFLEYPELEFFEMLLSVSGIGPKSALAILGITSVETLRKAIGTGDTSYLTKVSGIGRKTAEKIILELRDKMGDKTEGEIGSASLQGDMDSMEALKSLGYSQSEAREALKKVSQKASLNADTNSKIREALKILGGK